jgi:N4-gp56 family major capsid protein
MALNAYSGTNATNGNPTNVQAVVELLDAADAVVVVDKFVTTKPVKANKGETMSFLRAVTPDVDTTESAQGVNKAARALTYEQVTKTMEEFEESFAVTSHQAELGEYDVLKDSEDRLLDLIKRTREQNAWEEYRGCNNALFNSSAHTVITQVNGPITGGRLEVVSRMLDDNRAPRINKATRGSVNVGTTPIEPSFIVFCHTDCKSDIRRLPGVTLAHQVGGNSGQERVLEVFAYWNDFCFVTSPEFKPRLAAGAAVGSTGMKSVGSVSVDVYDYVCFGREAFGKCSLAGEESKEGMGGIKLNVLKDADKSDPTNKRRIVAARWWDGPIILDQNRCATIQCGATLNPT